MSVYQVFASKGPRKQRHTHRRIAQTVLNDCPFDGAELPHFLEFATKVDELTARYEYGQQRLGLAFLLLSIGLALAWGGRAFFPPRQAPKPTPDNSSIAAPGGNKAI